MEHLCDPNCTRDMDGICDPACRERYWWARRAEVERMVRRLAKREKDQNCKVQILPTVENVGMSAREPGVERVVREV